MRSIDEQVEEERTEPNWNGLRRKKRGKRNWTVRMCKEVNFANIFFFNCTARKKVAYFQIEIDKRQLRVLARATNTWTRMFYCWQCWFLHSSLALFFSPAFFSHINISRSLTRTLSFITFQVLHNHSICYIVFALLFIFLFLFFISCGN